MQTARRLFFNFLPFWAFLLLFKFAGALHYTLLSPYGERLLPLWVVGLLIGGESIIQVMLDIPAGWLVDRFGARRLLLITTFFFMLSALCLASGLTLLTYVLTIFMSIFGWLFFGPGANAYSLANANENESGRFFSMRDMSNSVGVVLASIALPFVLLLPTTLAGYILLVLLGFAFLAILLSPKADKLPALVERTTHQRRHVRREPLRRLWHAIRHLNPASGMLLLLTSAGATFYGVIWFSVPLVIAAQQANAGLLGVGLAIFDFSIVVLGYVLGLIADKGDKRAFVFFGLLLFAVSGMALGFNFGWLFLIFGFLATTGDEMAGVSLWSWLHHLDREHANDGAVSGVITLSEDLGYAIGPILAGFLYTAVGPTWTITLGALPILTVWLIYYVFVHRHFPYEALYALAPSRPHRRRHHKS